MRNIILASLASLPIFAAAAPAAADPGGPPGVCDCAAPAMATVVVVVPPPAPLPRWSISLRAGGLGLHPEEDPDSETSFGGGGLAVGYRLAPRWVIAAVLEGAHEQLENGEPGDHHLSLFTVEAQFHPRPRARWDWYLSAGLGGAAIAVGEDENAEVVQSGGAFTFGGGIERKFGHWGIGAQLRAIGLALEDVEPTDAARMTTTPEEEPIALSGGAFSISGSYHF